MILYILNIERTLNIMEEIMSNIAGTTILVIIVVYLIWVSPKLMGLAKRNNTRSLWEFKLVGPR